jgi:hypothetical protein
VTVLVTVGSDPSNTKTYTYRAPPTISGISPALGSTAGGTSVVIVGEYFYGVTGVTIGGKVCTPPTPTVTTTQISCYTPSGTGTVNVEVTAAGGTVSKAGAFTYVAPPTFTVVTAPAYVGAYGPLTAGTSVKITGEIFIDGATKVTFDGSECTSPTVTTTPIMYITCSAPAHAAGGVKIKIETTTPTNGANLVLSVESPQANAFTYISPPTISSITKAGCSNAGQTCTITITGAYFGSDSPTFTTDSVTFSRTSPTLKNVVYTGTDYAVTLTPLPQKITLSLIGGTFNKFDIITVTVTTKFGTVTRSFPWF